jgi:PAP2 superfamily
MKYRLLRKRSSLARVLLYIVLIVVCWEVYHYISLMAPRHTAIAHQHAAALIALESRLGILVEPQIQHFALYHAHPPVLGRLLDNTAVRNEVKQIYTGGQIPWLASMLIWVALFRPRYLKRLCILAIAGSLIGIMVAALYPVAPPRFAMAGPPYYMEDVNMSSSPEQLLVRYGGFDPYAAMPSLHMLWGLISGFGLFLGTRRWHLRLLATVFPITIAADVIITGNHYVLDCLARIGVQPSRTLRRARTQGGAESTAARLPCPAVHIFRCADVAVRRRLSAHAGPAPDNQRRACRAGCIAAHQGRRHTA